jgi:hypothetical protein
MADEIECEIVVSSQIAEDVVIVSDCNGMPFCAILREDAGYYETIDLVYAELEKLCSQPVLGFASHFNPRRPGSQDLMAGYHSVGYICILF